MRCHGEDPVTKRRCQNEVGTTTNDSSFLCPTACVFDMRCEIPNDPISPNHYQAANGMRVIDVIRAFKLGFELGNVVKYVLRGGHKEGATKEQDLRKARQYIDFELESITKEAK